MARLPARGPFGLYRSSPVYANPWVKVREDIVCRPDGARGHFGVVEVEQGVSVLALDADRNVFLAREYKYAVARETLEVVSGGLTPGEDPALGARRELSEEAGLTAARWTSLGTVEAAPTVLRAFTHLFLAEELTFGIPHPDPGEVLTIEKMPLSEALARVLDGTIRHAASAVLILKAARLHL